MPIPNHLNPLRWFPEFLEFGHRRVRRQMRLLGAALLVGVVAGVGAILFYVTTQVVAQFALGQVVGYRPEPPPAGEPEFPSLKGSETPFRHWLLLLVPAAGGLISGVLVFSIAPEAEGHGTDAVIDAYHHRQGVIRPRVPLVKIITSAITIGKGVRVAVKVPSLRSARALGRSLPD